MTEDYRVCPATAAAIQPALSFLFRTIDARERPGVIARAHKLLKTGELPLDSLRLLYRGTELAGAILAMEVPGKVGLIWPPQAQTEAGADALVRDTLASLRTRGVRLVQALLRSEELAQGKPLLRNAFQHVTTLQFLRHDLHLMPADGAEAAPLHFESLESASQTDFEQTLLRTYEGTQDCPELNGLRSIEEILSGHRAQGVFHPSRWWLAREQGMPVGVVLATAAVADPSWELSYMGLIPVARGRGLGRQLVRRVLEEARAAQARRVILSVDIRNIPARQLYYRLGFEPYDRREVLLAVLQ